MPLPANTTSGGITTKKLVAYFSPTGTTARLAQTLAEAVDADIFEIKPEVLYKSADLNWMDTCAQLPRREARGG